MADCVHLDGCPIFAQFKNEGAADSWVAMYCRGPLLDRCKRRELRERGETPPANMLPSGQLAVCFRQ